MRKLNLLIKTVFLLCALVGFTTSTLAGNKTDVITSANLAATSTTYKDFSNVTITSDAVYAGNTAKSSSGGIQLRSKNSNSGIVSTTTGGKVKSVTITVESGSNTIDVYGSNTAYTSAAELYGSPKGTKVGSLSATGTINFTSDYEYIGIRSNSGAVYISEISIVWETSSGSNKLSADLSFAVSSYKVAYDTNFPTPTLTNPNNLTVTYSSSDEEIALVDENSGEIVIGNTKAGTATITASSAANDTYEAGSATYTITVYDPNANDGSELKPYTVTEALALINTLGTASSSPVYVKGKVKEVTEYNSKYHSLTYNIEDLDDNANVLLVYGGKNLGNTDFSAATDLSIGDEVVVYGSLKMFNTTPEFNQNNFISQLKHGSEPEVRSIEVKAANKYKSYVSSQNLVVPAGVTAYIATGETATELTLTSVPKIKAGTPVILYANATEDTGFSFQITDDEVTYPATNLLKISDGTVVNGAYVLAKKNDVVGFYKWAGGALSPGKVYVEPSSAALEFIGFNFDEVTGINEVKNEKETVNGIFDLQGRKVVTPSKGLYIVNGKKVVIK